MLLVIASWVYIFSICAIVGIGSLAFIERITENNNEKKSVIRYVVAGIVAITVYSQYFSLFLGVGLVANIIIIALCIYIILKQKALIGEMFSRIKNTLFSWQGLLYIGLILVVAFYTSRGIEHHDTGLYHAQMIRWIEEYGIVKGLGNLFCNYAYNSSFFCFTAFFSMKFLLGISLHTTNGFIAIVMCIFAFERLRRFKEHKKHIADFACVSIVFYAIVSAAVIMSPATDAPSMFMLIYFIERFLEIIENDEVDYLEMSTLMLGLVYLVTLKVSCGTIILLAISPAVWLIKNNKIKQILIYILSGLIVVLPYLIRNIIISGYILYPMSGLDLFNFDWEMAKDVIFVDSAQIKVWGRCLYDINLIDMPLKEWLPIWFEHQERYEIMLLVCDVLAVVGNIVLLFEKLIKKAKVNWNLFLLNIVCLIGVLFWIMTSPFIRYALGLLLVYPMIYYGSIVQTNKMTGLNKIITGFLIFITLWCQTPYLDHYLMDDMVTAKQQVTQWKYYITPQDYNKFDVEAADIDGFDIYFPTEGDRAGYYGFPGANHNMELFKMRGNSLKDGFKANE